MAKNKELKEKLKDLLKHIVGSLRKDVMKGYIIAINDVMKIINKYE